jgi:hypothetical protein
VLIYSQFFDPQAILDGEICCLSNSGLRVFGNHGFEAESSVFPRLAVLKTHFGLQ